MDNIFIIAAWSTVGQFIVGTLSFVLLVWGSGRSLAETKAHLFLWAGLTLALPGLIICLLSIITITSLWPGALVEIIIRISALSTVTGVTWGILWARKIFPRIAP